MEFCDFDQYWWTYDLKRAPNFEKLENHDFESSLAGIFQLGEQFFANFQKIFRGPQTSFKNAIERFFSISTSKTDFKFDVPSKISENLILGHFE